MKKMINFVLMAAMLLTMAISVHAIGCCSLAINSVEETDEGIVVSYNYSAYEAPRHISIQVKHAESYGIAFSDVVEAQPQGSCTYTIDPSNLVRGETYEISLWFADECPINLCEDGSLRRFTCQNGLPVLEYDDLPDGKLEVMENMPAIVKVQAVESGFYSFGVTADISDDWSVRVYPYPYSYSYVEDYFYMEAGEEQMFHISHLEGRAMSVTAAFGPVAVQEHKSQNDDPDDGNLCFEIAGNRGLHQITLVKGGVYHFSSGREEDLFQILTQTGELCTNKTQSMDGCSTALLEPGSYYVDTSSCLDDFVLDVTYDVPDALAFGKTYTIGVQAEQFYRLDVDWPVHLTRTGNTAVRLYGEDLYIELDNNDPQIALPSGSYYLELTGGSSQREISFTGTPIDSIPLGEAFLPELFVREYYCAAFQAPEAGEYEIEAEAYQRVVMEKGEWLLLKMSEQTEILVKKYQRPDSVELGFGVPAVFEFEADKSYFYTFTPETTGMYKLVDDRGFDYSVKVWEGDALIAEEEFISQRINLPIELTENVPVLIEVRCLDWNGLSSSYAVSLTMTSLYTEITDSATLTVYSSNEELARYTAAESGFYHLYLEKVKRGWNDWDSAYFTMSCSDERHELYRSAEFDFWMEAGDELVISVEPFISENYSYCTVNISMSQLELHPLESGQHLDEAGSYSFTPQQTGLYELRTDSVVASVVTKQGRTIELCVSDESLVFPAEAGKLYLVDVSTVGTGMTLSPADTTAIGPNAQYTAEGSAQLFALTIAESGAYRVMSDTVNQTLYLYSDGWRMLKEGGISIADLESGTYYMAAIPAEVDPEQGAYEPKSVFSFVREDTGSDWSITLTDCRYLIGSGCCLVDVSGTVPRGLKEIFVGVEYTDDTGEAMTSTWYCDVDTADQFIAQIYVSELTIGKDYTFKPFYLDEEEQSVYGDAITLTVGPTVITKQLKASITKTDVRLKTGHEGFSQYFIYSFTLPADAEGTTTINAPFFDSWFSLYDESGNYISTASRTDEGNVYKLAAGETYYLSFSSYLDGLAEIKISSLPEPAQEPGSELYEVLNMRKTVDGVRFDVSGDVEGKTILAAIYDETNRMLEAAICREQHAVLTQIGKAAQCKLFFLDMEHGTMIPYGPEEPFDL